MQSIDFPGATLRIGEGQPEYSVLKALSLPGPEGELIMCFELTDEELEEIKKTKRIYYHRLTFGQTCHHCGKKNGFQPMKITTSLDSGIDLTE